MFRPKESGVATPETIPISLFGLVVRTDDDDASEPTRNGVDGIELEEVLEAFLFSKVQEEIPDLLEIDLTFVGSQKEATYHPDDDGGSSSSSAAPSGTEENTQDATRLILVGSLVCAMASCPPAKEIDDIVLRSLVSNYDELLEALHGAEDPLLHSAADVYVSTFRSSDSYIPAAANRNQEVASSGGMDMENVVILIVLVSLVVVVLAVALAIYGRKRRFDAERAAATEVSGRRQQQPSLQHYATQIENMALRLEQGNANQQLANVSMRSEQHGNATV